jgi:hypothetical protein
VMVGVVCVFWVVPLPPPPQPATNRTALTSKNGERIAYPRSNHDSCLGCRVNAKVTRGART